MGERATGSGRLASLDGLRGLAALAVLLYHCMMISPAIVGVWRREVDLEPGQWEWWAVRTPLHLLWSGDEAVVVFFVLSGFVLTLPALRETHRWSPYLAKRLVRLYLPVWASLGLAVAVLHLFATGSGPGQSGWVQDRTVGDHGVRGVLSDATLVTPDVTVNGTLWSLHYELLFSLLLPLYLVFARRARRWWGVKVAALLAVILAGRWLGAPWLEFLPVFAVGASLAVERDRVVVLALNLKRWQWASLLVAAGALLMIRWIGLPGNVAAATVAAGILIVACQHHRATRRVTESGPVQWLGRRSFSLYLVHEPIVVAVATSAGATSPWLPILIAVPTSLIVAALFFRFIERPSHRLANAAGRAVERQPSTILA